jgi:hypothetical protein
MNDKDGNSIPYVPLQTKVIYCPTCFGTGRELDTKERLEFLKKQREEAAGTRKETA